MLSIVVCSADTNKCAAFQHHFTHLLVGKPFEIIAIHDAVSLGEGYNRGLRQSVGDAVLFCHDDIEILTPNFYERLISHLRRCDLLGVMGTSRLVGIDWRMAGIPHVFGQVATRRESFFDVTQFGVHRPLMGNMMALDGVFLAFRRAVFDSDGLRWDETLPGFHGHAVELTARAHAAGKRLAVASDIGIIHSPSSLPPTTHANDAALLARLQPHLLPHPSTQTRHFTLVRLATRHAAAALMTPPSWMEAAP